MEQKSKENGTFCQAVIENVFRLKDGSVVAGCNLMTGTVNVEDTLYYIDCNGRSCFPVKVSGIAVPEKGGIKSITAGEEHSNHAAFRILDHSLDQLHAGHILQSEPEDVLYEEAPGWNAITECFEKHYPGQKHPLHFGSYASFKPGEAGPLDGISVYDGGDCFHFVTYGMSELYEKQNGNPERSGFGFELTLKLKKEGLENPLMEVRHICSLLQMAAGITMDNGHQFLPGQFIMVTKGRGFDAAGKSKLTGFVTKQDECGTIETPFGKVQFVQLIGVTQEELIRMKDGITKPEDLVQQLGAGLTDYKRN